MKILILGVAAFIGWGLVTSSMACLGSFGTSKRIPSPTSTTKAPVFLAPQILVPQENTDWHANVAIKLMWNILEGADKYEIILFEPSKKQKTLKTSSIFYHYTFREIGRHVITVAGKRNGQYGDSSHVNFDIRAKDEQLRNPMRTEFHFVPPTIQVKAKPNIIPLRSVRPPLRFNRPVSSKPRIYVPQPNSEMYPGPLTIVWERFLNADSKLKIIHVRTNWVLFVETLTTNQMTIVFVTPGEYKIQLSNDISDQGKKKKKEKVILANFRVLSYEEQRVEKAVDSFVEKSAKVKSVTPMTSPMLDIKMLPQEFFNANLGNSLSSPPAIFAPQMHSEMYLGLLTIIWQNIKGNGVQIEIIDADDTVSILFSQTVFTNCLTFQFGAPGHYLIKVANVDIGRGVVGNWNMVVFRVLMVHETVKKSIETFLMPKVTHVQLKIPRLDKSQLPQAFLRFDPAAHRPPSSFSPEIYAPQENTEMHPGFLTILWEKMDPNSFAHLQLYDEDDIWSTASFDITVHNQNIITLNLQTPGNFRIELAEFHMENERFDYSAWTEVKFHVLPSTEEIKRPINTFVLRYYDNKIKV